MATRTMSRLRSALAAIWAEGGPSAKKARAGLLALCDELPVAPRKSEPRKGARVERTISSSVSELELEAALARAEGPAADLLATRMDISPEVRAELRRQPRDVQVAYLDAHPSPQQRRATEEKALAHEMRTAADAGCGTARAEPLDAERLREQMGLPSRKPATTFNGAVQVLRALTRAEAQAIYEEQTKGTVRP